MKRWVLPVLALVIAGALVTTVSAGNPLDQVLTIVKDIQTKVNTLVSMQQEEKCTWDLAPVPDWGNYGMVTLYVTNYGAEDEVIEFTIFPNNPEAFSTATIHAKTTDYLQFTNINTNMFRLKGSRNIAVWGIATDGATHYEMIGSGDFAFTC